MPLSRADQARVNGAKSRGPVTPGGKARSSLNALKHGRYATNAVVLSNEDADALEELVASYVCRIQPTDPVEYSLTRELASIDWRLTRVFAIDTRMFDREMDIQLPAHANAGLSLSELTRLLDASRSIVDRSKLPAYLARREAQLINARRSILAVLKEMRRSFPSSDPAPEVVPPQPLDPDSPLANEPGTDPRESRPEFQSRAGSPEPASKKPRLRAQSTHRPLPGPLEPAGPAPTGAAQSRAGSLEPASEGAAPDPAPEQSSPQPAAPPSIASAADLPVSPAFDSREASPGRHPVRLLPSAASNDAAPDPAPGKPTPKAG